MDHPTIEQLRKWFNGCEAYIVGSRAFYELGYNDYCKDTDIITNKIPYIHFINEGFQLTKNKMGGDKFVHPEKGWRVDVWIQTPEGFINRAKQDGFNSMIFLPLDLDFK